MLSFGNQQQTRMRNLFYTASSAGLFGYVTGLIEISNFFLFCFLSYLLIKLRKKLDHCLIFFKKNFLLRYNLNSGRINISSKIIKKNTF